ncbi:MAG: isoleucine--tRNA ligase [Bacilli bacterium]
MYKKLNNKKVSENEKDMSLYWEENNIFQKSIDTKDDKKMFVFYDGPATANGYPGLHHMLAKMLKDSFCKYRTMKGNKVLRKIGWDTHGLPVEVQVEKELGFSDKSDIEKYGIDKFNIKCKENVWKNEEAFKKLTTEMGQFIDMENKYITYDNKYIETEWYILKKFFDEGLFYEGQKILPYCPRCGTGLASHEVAQGYKEITVTTVTVPFKLKNENTYLLVWTTTPWTLIANTGLCVNPNEVYVKVESHNNSYIVAKKLVSTLFDEYEVKSEFLGKTLEYKEYDRLLDFLPVDKKGFFICCDSYVTVDSGTGIVHIAPCFGEDDSKVGRKYNLPLLNPVNEKGLYAEGPWKDMLVFDADIKVIEYLKENNLLFKKQKMLHNYPHCWRCNSPLIYCSKPSFYLEITKIKNKIIKANKTVSWYPSYVGEKRFGNWLENLNDWAISRNRYWGTPLPLWRCSCGHDHMIGSIKELKELSIKEINDEDIDLHRPFVDDICIICDKCGKKMTRVKSVIDCWFDSGSMPFSQYHYPFENKKLFDSQFPADFIAEGIDQTRGWFYSLMVISVFLTGKSPYKNVLVNELLLDKYGKKMHKSKGNSIEPFGLIEKYGSDAIRWYLPYISPVWLPIKFDEEGLKDVTSKFFGSLKNTYSFFEMYANADNLDKEFLLATKKDYELIDLWIMSKYNNLVDYVTKAYDEYDLNRVVKSISSFVIDDLSNWYIRRNRKRFWATSSSMNKNAVYKVTYEVLCGICKLIAPVSSFIADEIFINLTGEESVHLSDFPVCNEEFINNKLEEEMEEVKNIVVLGRACRESAKIKIRQPISKIILDGKSKELLNDFSSIINEELNVKTVCFEDDLSIYMNIELKPNYKKCGPILGSSINDFAKTIKNMNIEDVVNKKIIINNVPFFITNDMVELNLSSKEGFDAQENNNKFVVIDTHITKELEREGVFREIVRTCQLLRKEALFNVEDRIYINIISNNKDLCDIINSYKKEIEKELLATFDNNQKYDFIKEIEDEFNYTVMMRKVN